MPGRFLRHATVYEIGPGPRPGELAVVSAVTVHYTNPDGETRVFAVGRYHDVVTVGTGAARLASREVRLETRALEPGSHLPM
jgi:methanesulfonate monooxygenase subunit beta